VSPTSEPHNTLNDLWLEDLSLVDSGQQLYQTQWTQGDGNCLFRAFARALEGGQRDHSEVREGAVHWIRGHSSEFAPFIPARYEGLDGYLVDMARDGTWGDNLMLQALCAKYEAEVWVYKEVDNGHRVWMLGGQGTNCQSTFYLYLSGHHYENLVGGDQISG
jgi:hypothetical protein